MSEPTLRAPTPQRYQAAWTEINARLQSRQTVGAVYMTAAIAMLGASIAASPPPASVFAWRLPFVVLLPVFSFAVAKWVRHNDAIIGLLSAYCASLEEVERQPHIPAWHSKGHGFITAALRYRLWTDQATAVIAVASLLPAILHAVVGTGLLIGTLKPSLGFLPIVPGLGLQEPMPIVQLVAVFGSVLLGGFAVTTIADNAVVRADYLERHSFAERGQRFAYWRFSERPNESLCARWDRRASFLLDSFRREHFVDKDPEGVPVQEPTD